MLPNGYKDFMKEKIKEFYNNNNRLPNKNDLKEYSVEPLIFEYGNWRYALMALGFLSEESIELEMKNLLQLQDQLEGAPSLEEANNAGIHTKLLIQSYNGWKNVKQELKKRTTKRYKIKKTKQTEFNEKIKKDEEILKEITKKYKRIPTVKMAINNGVEINRILKKYDSWTNAKKELQLYEIYETAIIPKIKELDTINQKTIEKELKKTKYIFKPTIKPLLMKYKTWENVCTKFSLNNSSSFTENEKLIIKQSLDNLNLIEKIIGKFPEIEDVHGYDVDVNLLLKKYGKWENIKR